jgi:hypothetical protein
MTKQALPRLRARSDPRLENLGLRHQYWVDYGKELLMYYDGHGVTHTFALADLSGKTLTHCMLEGAISLMKESSDPVTAWLALRLGFQPRARRRKYVPPRVLEKLSKAREAIVRAILAYGGTIERPAVEARVRKFTNAEVRLWNEEPDVILHYRELNGDVQLRLRLLAEELQKKA